ncbi:MAG: CRISPR-associated protein Cas4 [Planctomycetaceae bacterium]|nr:CRISPR-associated protein Cas4 [Planctomycetaceae bacterium]
MYAEADLLPLSALQHLVFCERQCALIHVERQWGENRLTAQGQVLHKKAHDGKPETRDGERITRGLPLRSLALGITGQADVVLWRPPPGLRLTGRSLAEVVRTSQSGDFAGWAITPVEYKRGRPKKNDCDRVQLCAQAICLEEMLGVAIPAGQLFYGVQRRRFDVSLDAPLRDVTRTAARRLHELLAAGVTPPAAYEKKCDACSLLDVCLPRTLGGRSAAQYLHRELLSARSES